MKVKNCRAILFLALVCILFGHSAADAKPWDVQANLRVRVEDWHWFNPLPTRTGQQLEYLFVSNLLKVAASHKGKDVDSFIEVSVPWFFGIPEDAVAPAPKGQLGFGGTYRFTNGRQDGTVFINQAFSTFKFNKETALKLGRFEFIEGQEVLDPDPTMTFLKKERIAHRLIGNFGFSNMQRSFDGAVVTHDDGKLNFTGMAGRPRVGVFDFDGMESISEIDVVYGALTYRDTKEHLDARLFGIYYDDSRNLPKVDNRSTAMRNVDFEDIQLATIGGHFVKKFNQVDVLFWGCTQFGDWGPQDHSAESYDAEIGYQPGGEWQPWIRVGTTHASGDSNALDGRHETFFQILPTPRIYARFPFFADMNLNDHFVSFMLKPTKTFSIRTEYHDLHLAEANDFWYSGGGAFNRGVFGFVGRPSGGSTDLSDLVDLALDKKINATTTGTFYYAKAFGGQVMKNIYPSGSDATYIYVEVNHRF
jgi:hypothetical protein